MKCFFTHSSKTTSITMSITIENFHEHFTAEYVGRDLVIRSIAVGRIPEEAPAQEEAQAQHVEQAPEHPVEEVQVQEPVPEENCIFYNGQFVPSKVLNEADLMSSHLLHSKIIAASITYVSSHGHQVLITNKLKYASLMLDIWRTMSQKNILKYSSFNFRMEKDITPTNGYQWCSDIDLAFQRQSAARTLKEILHLCRVNNYQIDMVIQLKNGSMVEFQT